MNLRALAVSAMRDVPRAELVRWLYEQFGWVQMLDVLNEIDLDSHRQPGDLVCPSCRGLGMVNPFRDEDGQTAYEDACFECRGRGSVPDVGVADAE